MLNDVEERLWVEWQRTCAGLNASPAGVDAAFAQLVAAYASPGRAYHTLTHIEAVLRTLAAGRTVTQDFTALQMAAWYHDAIYDPRASDNEERSADLAAAALPDLGVSATTIAEVRRLILLTKTHDPSDNDIDGQLLIDADLAILGAPAADYRQYAAAIREEYAWVPEEAYRTGRAAVLERFLGRPRIYHRVVGLEEPARQNLRNEIDALKK